MNTTFLPSTDWASAPLLGSAFNRVEPAVSPILPRATLSNTDADSASSSSAEAGAESASDGLFPFFDIDFLVTKVDDEFSLACVSISMIFDFLFATVK